MALDGVSSRNGINNTLRVSGSAQGAEFSGFGLAGVVPGVVAGEVDEPGVLGCRVQRVVLERPTMEGPVEGNSDGYPG